MKVSFDKFCSIKFVLEVEMYYIGHISICPAKLYFLKLNIFVAELATGVFSYLLWFPVPCEFIAQRSGVISCNKFLN